MAETNAPIPGRVASSAAFSSVATGTLHNCALTREGVAYCWGLNSHGELGSGTTRDEAAAQRVSTDHRFVSIAAGGDETAGFACAVTADAGKVFCWGDARHGQLGNGSTNGALIPIPTSNP